MKYMKPTLLLLLLLILILLLFHWLGPGPGTGGLEKAAGEGMTSDQSKGTLTAEADQLDPSALAQGSTSPSGSGSGSASHQDGSAPPSDARSSAFRLFGTVTQENGSPVADAAVYLVAYPGAVAVPEPVRSDSQGQFTFTGALKGAYLLYASKPPQLSFLNRRELPRLLITGQESSMGPFQLVLKEAVNLNLSVSAQVDKKPIDQAQVLVRGELNLSFTTDPNGQTLINLSPGIWSLEVSAPGFVPKSLALDLKVGTSPTQEVALESAGLVTGTISNTAGDLLQAIEVHCLFRQKEYVTESDVDGSYFFDSVPMEGPFTLFFQGEGYEDAYLNWQRFGLGQTTREVDISLKALPDQEDLPKINLDGSVLNRQAKPIAGATVYYRPSQTGPYQETRANQEGRFQVEVSETHKPMVFAASAPGYANSYTEVLCQKGSLVEMRLDEPHQLKGNVKDPWGAPLAGVTLKVKSSSQGVAAAIPNEPSGTSYSDEAGLFQLEGLAERVELQIQAWGYLTLKKDLVFNGPIREETFVLEPLGILRGKLVGEDDRPCTQFRIQIEKETTGEETTWVDPTWKEPGIEFHAEDGRFQIDHLPPGVPMKLRIQAKGYAIETIIGVMAQPEESAEELLLTLRNHGKRLGGRILDSRGLPVAGARLQALVYPSGKTGFNWNGYFRGSYLRDTLTSEWTQTDDSGSFLFEGLPGEAGLELLIDSPGLALAHFGGYAEMNEAAQTQILIRTRPAARISGWIDLTTFPNAKRLELVQARNSLFTIPYLIGTQGTFQFEQLPPGKYSLTLSGWQDPRNQEKLKTESVELSEGQTLEINLDQR